MSLRAWALIVLLFGLASAVIIAKLDNRGANRPGAADISSYTEADSTHAAGAHILISYNGADPKIPGVDRTRQEALNRATDVFVKALDYPMGFADLAREYSDDPRAKLTGGYFGINPSWKLPLELSAKLFSMDFDEIRGPIETEMGFHVLKRLPIVIVEARHILISWQGAQRADDSVTRNREQAWIIASEVLLQCRDEKNDFCDLAARFSDDVDGRFDCGTIGLIEPAMVHSAIEEVLFRMDSGEISDIVETEFGFHILMRIN
jgi:parvulin-like peptidyl-prolyl isomerase